MILPALRGSWMGPRSPSSALAVLFHHALSGSRIAGDMPALMSALQTRAEGLGVQLKTDARVAALCVEEGAVKGVELADGSRLDASLVVSTIGPRRTLLGLVPT